MASFSQSILKNTKAIKQEINDKITGVAVYGFQQAIAESPSEDRHGSEWSTGLLINQWYPAYNSVSTMLTSQTDGIGIDSLQRVYDIKDKNYFYGKDGYVSLTNNVSYAYRADTLGWKPSAEHPSWTGKVAPYAMVDKAMHRMKVKTG